MRKIEIYCEVLLHHNGIRNSLTARLLKVGTMFNFFLSSMKTFVTILQQDTSRFKYLILNNHSCLYPSTVDRMHIVIYF